LSQSLDCWRTLNWGKEGCCTRCGDPILLADTEEWKKPLCFDCWFEAGSPEKEPEKELKSMGTTKQEIAGWFDRGVAAGNTHVVVVCDTFSHEDYPVFVKKEEDVREVYDKYNGKNMQRVMEVYCLSMPKEAQLAEHRAFHLETVTRPK
jgi:hypothetical protein